MGSAEQVKKEVFSHMVEVKAERRVAMKLHQECAARAGWNFQYDDKCGSEYMHLPAAARERAAVATRYKYRFGLQGNITPGSLMSFSLVPPCLYTGGNFGCSTLLSHWLQLMKLNKLGHSFIRMTDSGSDNNTATTHTFHWLMIHLGVFNRIEWVRLRPKHSHNFADRCNSMVKEVIWPKRGAEGGCPAPWDMHKVIKNAMSTQTAPAQLLWQWTNWDFNAWFSQLDLVDKEFADFSKYRWWVYEVSSCSAS